MAGVLIYHVKRKVKLADGDFFGVIGILLLSWMMMCYDAKGVHTGYIDRVDYTQSPSRYVEMDDWTTDNEKGMLVRIPVMKGSLSLAFF